MPLLAVRGNGPAGAYGFGAASGAADAYTLIDTVTVTSSVSSVTFSSIPADYDDLQITYRINQSSTEAFLTMRFNNNTSSIYDANSVQTYNSNTAASSVYNNTSMFLTQNYGIQVNAEGGGVIDILNYASTTYYKTAQIFSGNSETNHVFHMSAGTWPDTAAISSIQILDNGTTAYINAGSKFSLYGITRAQ